MTKRRSSLTGSWSGAYRYPGDQIPETVFNAQIEEVAGAFTGNIQEPNLTRPWNGPLNTAEMEGTREGSAVSFAKFYTGNSDIGHAVAYEGSVDEASLRIEGTWTIPGSWSGTFFMTRDDLGEEEAVELEVEAPIEIRK